MTLSPTFVYSSQLI